MINSFQLLAVSSKGWNRLGFVAPTSPGVMGRWDGVEGNSSQDTISPQGQDLTARGNYKDKQLI